MNAPVMNTEALAEPIAGRPAGTGRPALHDAAPRRADGRRDAAPVDDRHGAGAAPAYGHLVSSGVDTSHGAILYLEDVTVSFDGFRALNALSLTLDDGELRCIIGPNGAGKTTMMDAVTGRIRPDSGRIFYGQTIDLTRLAEAQIVAAGIGRKFQRPTVFETMSVFDNMELALENDMGTTITTGRTRKTSTPMALAASAARLTQATVGLALKCFREALIWTPRGGSAAGTGRTARGSPPAARWKWPMRSPSSASG